MDLLRILETRESGYRARTQANVDAADLTVAFAKSYTTSGEQLTRRLAGDEYLAIPLGSDIGRAAHQLAREMKTRGAHSLNIAGNGSHSLSRYGVSQDDANQWVFAVLRQSHDEYPLQSLRSGGQTGVDLAALIAGVLLNIPTTALLPRGFVQRSEDGVDAPHSASEIRDQVMQGAAALQDLRVAMAISAAPIRPRSVPRRLF
jgi:hypothetical protein